MITANDIVKANEVLKNVVERTPLDFDRYLSEKYGATIYIKKENMQKVRSFKLRGAYYANHLYASNHASPKNWSSTFLWW